MKKGLFLILCCLCSLYVFGQHELTKSIDFGDKVTNVQQEEDAWCVYACLESVKGYTQCGFCRDFIYDYLMKDSCKNAYGSSYISDDDYRSALHDLDVGEDDVCINTSRYGLFGVVGGDADTFLQDILNYRIISTQDFVKNFRDVNSTLDEPPFLIFSSSDYSHCTVLKSFELYDNDWYDKDSKITIMDPEHGDSKDITYAELMSISVVFGK